MANTGITYSDRRPSVAFDETGVKYEVDVDDGFINIIQEGAYGEDKITAMSPDDARWLIACLTRACDSAQRHDRWIALPKHGITTGDKETLFTCPCPRSGPAPYVKTCSRHGYLA